MVFQAESAARRWPPKWLAFYHTKVFEEKRYTIQHYGRVRERRVVKRRSLREDAAQGRTVAP